MAKKSYAEMKELLTSQKDEAKQARKDLKDFCKQNKLDTEQEHPDNKKWSKIKGLVDKTAKAVAETEKWLEENKDKKETKARKTQYEYPADCTSAADKKKFRAQARAAAKKAAKGEAGATKASKKKDKGEEAAAPTKKEKKKKKEAAAEAED